MGGFQNFAISFTIISILAGCLTSFYDRVQPGRPGRDHVGLAARRRRLHLRRARDGEIASTYPTAGGLYYWASKLGSPAWGWFTGWFNLDRTDRGHRGDRLRLRDLHDVAAEPALRITRTRPWSSSRTR